MLQKGITAMRSFVVEPMQHGRLFLAAIPPYPAADRRQGHEPRIRRRRRARARHGAALQERRGDPLERYSRTCLRRVWKAQRFSWWMTQMLHLHPTTMPSTQMSARRA